MCAKQNPASVETAFTPSAEHPACVLIVDDHAMVRKGIRACIDAYAELSVCGEAATASEALALLEKLQPHIAVVDLSLPGADGIDLLRAMQNRYPEVRALVLSMHDERVYAERALRAGARGYVMKQEPPERVIEGVIAVLRGELFVSREIAHVFMALQTAPARRGKARKVGVACLSDRELQVFGALGRGQSSQEIALMLNISPKTVDTYRANIKRKLGLERNNALIHAAIRWVENEAAGLPPRGQETALGTDSQDDTA